MHIVKGVKTGKEKLRFYKLTELIPLHVSKNGRFYFYNKGFKIRLGEKSCEEIKRSMDSERSIEKIIIEGKEHIYQEINEKKVLVLFDGYIVDADGYVCVEYQGKRFIKVEDWWYAKIEKDRVVLQECQSITTKEDGAILIDGVPKSEKEFFTLCGKIESSCG